MNNESSSSRTQSCIIVEYSLTRQGEQTFGIRRQTEQVCGRGRGNITLINRLAPTSFLQIFRTEVVILRHSYAILRHSYAILRPSYVHSTALLRTFYATFSPILRHSYVHSTDSPSNISVSVPYSHTYIQLLRMRLESVYDR